MPSRFDRGVLLLIAATVLTLMGVIWRGDQVGLRVATLSPPTDAENVSVHVSIRLRFDQPLAADDAKLPQLTFDPPLDGDVTVDGDSLVFTPAAALAPDTQYTAQLDAGLVSRTGRRLRDPVTWQFSTGHISIVYSMLDDRRREQLMLAPVNLGPDEVTLGTPQAVTDNEYGIWDFGVDGQTGQIVYSVLAEDGTSDLWTVTPGGDEPQRLQECPQAACNSVAFSPDSRLLAFAQRNATDLASPVVSPPRLWLLDLANGNAAQLFADSQQLGFEPRWSPDGKWLSYVSPDLGGVGVYNLDTGDTRFYPTTTGEAAIWNPTRNELVMSAMMPDSAVFAVHLFAVDPVSDTRRDLSMYEFEVDDTSPAWSPDGKWLAFRRKELTGPQQTLGKQLWVMAADGSAARPLTLDMEVDHGPPSWSPDGRYWLYHRFPLRGPDVTISVWVMEVATGQAWEVARPGQRPQWVP